MTEPSSVDAGAEALLGLAAGRSVRLPSPVPDVSSSSSAPPAQPPPFRPPVDRLPALSEWRVEQFHHPLPPTLLEPPPPDALRPSPWPSHQYAYPWQVGYAYPPSQLYYYPQPLPYQRQPLRVPPPPLVQPEVPSLPSLAPPLDKLRPLAEPDPILRPPNVDVNSAPVQPVPSLPLPPPRPRGGLADLINPTDTIPGTDSQVAPSHLSRAYGPVTSAPDKSNKSSLSILVEATNELPPSITPEKPPAMQNEPSDASTVLYHNASQSSCPRPSPPQLVTPLRLSHNTRRPMPQKDHQKSVSAENTLRPLVIPPNHLASNSEPRDVTHFSADLQPVSKRCVPVVTLQSPRGAREPENSAVHSQTNSALPGDRLVRNTISQAIHVSHSATSVADVHAVTSAMQMAEADKMLLRKKLSGDPSATAKRSHLADTYSDDKSCGRNNVQGQRIATEDSSKYHTPSSKPARDANRTSGRGSRRSAKARGRRSRRRPLSVNDLDSEDNDNRAHDSESDGGVASVEGEDEGDNSSTEETRCPCGSKENSGVMIACDQCNTWQHGKCMGFRRNNELPENYFCNICRPDQMRPNCIAHPKYKERYGRDREGKDIRVGEADSLLGSIRPTELRKLFMSDLRNRKAVRSHSDVVFRYAFLFKTQFPKSRQAIVDGLSVLLELDRVDAAESFENAIRRLRTEKPQEDSVERKRSSVVQEEDHTEPSHRSNGSGRIHGLKRTRPSVSDGAEAGAARHDSGHVEGAVEIDLHSDSRGMSREERKLQQTMKLFARMEERERERKRPRTHEAGSSPRTSPPGRPKASRTGTQIRGSASKPNLSPSRAGKEDAGVKPAAPEARIQCRAADPKQKRQFLDPNLVSLSEPKQVSKAQPVQSHSSDIERAVLSHKSSATVRTGGECTKDAIRRERDSRSRERVEKPVLNRKESVSPENHNLGTRRRKHLVADRMRTNENKRRRTGLFKDMDRRSILEKDSPESEKALDFQLFVPGPSVLGSKSIIRERLCEAERARVEDEKMCTTKEKNVALKSNLKEWLLKNERRVARNKSQSLELEKSPVKKRLLTERKIEEIEREQSSRAHDGETDETVPSAAAHTVSVSMVVVSQKESLPDNGQILESTRLVLREKKKQAGKAINENFEPVVHALKKRPSMLAAGQRHSISGGTDVKPKPDGIHSEKTENGDHDESRERSPRSSSPKLSSNAPADISVNVSREVSPNVSTKVSPKVSPNGSKKGSPNLSTNVSPQSPKSSPKPPSLSSEKKSSKPPSLLLTMPSPKASTSEQVSASFLSTTVATEIASSPRRRSPMASPKLRSSPLPSFKSAIRSTTKSSFRESRSPSPLLAIEKKGIHAEKRSAVSSRDVQSSLLKSSSPSPERQASSNKSALSASTPRSGGDSGQKNGETGIKKPEIEKTDQERTAPEMSTMKIAEKRLHSNQAESSCEDKKRPNKQISEPTMASIPHVPLLRSPGPPLNALRSIRSVPIAEIRKASLGQITSNATAEVQREKSCSTSEPVKVDIPLSGATISDVFQRRLEGFWKPTAKTPVKPPAKPCSAPPISNLKGSTAKLGAALPLSSKPNLDSLRNSTGLSPRVSGIGNGYHRGAGSNFRSKSMDYDRSRSSVPTFSQSKRSQSYSHGRGYPRNGPHNVNGGKPSFHDDRRRFGPGRDSSHHSRNDDKGKNGGNGGTPTQLWSRSYAYRNSRPNMSEDHESNMNRRPGSGPSDPDGSRRPRKPLQDSWIPRQSLGFLGPNGGNNRRVNGGDNHGRGGRRSHGHHG
ncbi:unnamed protein product [Agarophyton chilense]